MALWIWINIRTTFFFNSRQVHDCWLLETHSRNGIGRAAVDSPLSCSTHVLTQLCVANSSNRSRQRILSSRAHANGWPAPSCPESALLTSALDTKSLNSGSGSQYFVASVERLKMMLRLSRDSKCRCLSRRTSALLDKPANRASTAAILTTQAVVIVVYIFGSLWVWWSWQRLHFAVSRQCCPERETLSDDSMIMSPAVL